VVTRRNRNWPPAEALRQQARKREHAHLHGIEVWGLLFLASGTAMGLAVWRFERRWAVITSLTVAFTLTTGRALAFVVRYLTSPSTTPETWVSWTIFDYLLLSVAVSIDRGPALPPPGSEVTEFRQAVDAALDAAEAGQRTAVLAAPDAGAGKRREGVRDAAAAYGDALRAIVPAGAMPPGEPAQQPIAEARNALARAEEAYRRATGQPAPPQDAP
jgi:hypothetical protein